MDLIFFFYKSGFGIKFPMKVDMPLNKETKPKLSNLKNVYQTKQNLVKTKR